MSTASQVEHLRARARQLRSISGMIGASRALTVYTAAGPETWTGPTPDACREALLTLRRQLQASQQSLADAARGLEQRADALEQQPPTLGLVS